METNYDEVYQVELINELSARVYGRLLNMVFKAGYDENDLSIFECLLLKQLREQKKLDLFEKNLEELAQIKAYWRAMNELTRNILGERNENQL